MLIAFVAIALAVAAAIVLGTGSSHSRHASTSTTGRAGGTAPAPTVVALYGSAPDSLDPQQSYTSQGWEALWVSYLGLYTYAHHGGAAGGRLIPALATAQPLIGDGGRTYTMTLRRHLVYSNGRPVRAGDFTYSIERALKLGWGGDSFYTSNIVGAAAYAGGKAKTISGIRTDDATGRIVVHLVAPYGAFENVLAFPSSGLVPRGTPMKDLTAAPPPGVGPYAIRDVVPNRSWVGAINPRYAAEAIPGIPPASVTVRARVESNTTLETEDVLRGSADLFDTADQIAPVLLPQVQREAAARYRAVPVDETYYFFLNTRAKPFDSPLVRQAVTMAIDRRAVARLDSGNLVPGCYFLPPAMIGHPTEACPYGDPGAAPRLARAKRLVARSGERGAAVTVWSEERQPKSQFATYYASVLSALGFRVTIRPIADSQYFGTIGNLRLGAQTGFDTWLEDFPNPGDFYQNNLDGNTIQPVNNGNASQVDDPVIQRALARLYPVPSGRLAQHAGEWRALDRYTAKKAYVVVLGYPLEPAFASSRIAYRDLVVQPAYGWDWTSIHVVR